MNTPMPYPVSSTSQIAAHFSGLQAEPPAHLAEAWRVLVIRRMAGQNVDEECAALLQQEREHNRRGVPIMPRWTPGNDTRSQTSMFTSRREPIGAGGRGSLPD
jgi:hypothetical protein